MIIFFLRFFIWKFGEIFNIYFNFVFSVFFILYFLFFGGGRGEEDIEFGNEDVLYCDDVINDVIYFLKILIS